jgi:hypothetical protein
MTPYIKEKVIEKAKEINPNCGALVAFIAGAEYRDSLGTGASSEQLQDATIPLEACKKGNELVGKEIERLRKNCQTIIEWVHDAGIKNVSLDDKKGMALYHIKHLALDSLNTKEGNDV